MLISGNIFIILALAVAFLISFSATPTVIALANKIKAIDIPKDERRIHKKPIPLIGGLAIFYGFVISVLCFAVIDRQVMGLLLGTVIIVTVGVIDDMRDLSAKLKLLFQIIAAAIVIYFGVEIDYVANPLAKWFGPQYINLGLWSIPITMVWIIGVTNAVNLIDGLDGLACGVSTIASVALLSMTLLSQNLNAAIITAALAGAGFGFLPYNFNPAKIFMGDTGSTFLGFVLACISIQGIMKMYALISIAVPVLILGLPIFDTLFAIMRRIAKKKPIMSPDRGHLHHRLLDMGFSQRQTVTILYTLTSILCLTAVVMSLKDAMRGLILVFAVLLVLLVSLVVMEPKEETVTEEKKDEEN
ncbi:MAG: undecaprenyl/decaprenyl-phosphate alpha-N-acetylglucosaminyl 1-phosphate transferase [Ruminococcaceae bacterium]|nr:undecaprenyl/decaprenyl-phosphate alpha-N-acetylglucosaminyl 1-phosphate transferase [Oscillospiraceae bacterium]